MAIISLVPHAQAHYARPEKHISVIMHMMESTAWLTKLIYVCYYLLLPPPPPAQVCSYNYMLGYWWKLASFQVICQQA